MSTACGRPQGGGGPAHVDACGQRRDGHKPDSFCGRHKWMAPYTLRFAPVPVQCPPILQVSPIFRCSYVLTLNFLPPTKILRFLPPKLPFVSPLNDKFPP